MKRAEIRTLADRHQGAVVDRGVVEHQHLRRRIALAQPLEVHRPDRHTCQVEMLRRRPNVLAGAISGRVATVAEGGDKLSTTRLSEQWHPRFGDPAQACDHAGRLNWGLAEMPDVGN